MAHSQVVVAHDYATQRGGAERVALVLARMYPHSQFMTALYNPDTSFAGYSEVDVRPSILNRVRMFRKNPQLALPVLHYAWSLRRRVSAAAILVSSSGWAHAVRASRTTAKVVYCHNPPRWIYQADEYLADRTTSVKVVSGLLRPMLRWWDQRAARTAHLYVANSTSVAERVKAVYGIDARVIHPPVTIDSAGNRTRPGGVPGEFFLTVGRQRGYKGTQDLIAAFRNLPEEQLVVVGGQKTDATDNVTILNDVDEGELRWLYEHATALISVSKEDFGLTPVEANAFGTPALLLRAGGFLDSLDEGVSGLFLQSGTVEGIVRSVTTFPRNWDRSVIREHAKKFSANEFERQMKQVVGEAIASLSSSIESGQRVGRTKVAP